MNPTWEFVIRLLKIKNEVYEIDAVFSQWKQGRENVRQTLCDIRLPPGYVFTPFDYEILIHHLLRKILGFQLLVRLEEIDYDFFRFHPQYLVDHHSDAKAKSGWFFSRKKSVDQANMSTENGYWKLATENEEIEFMNYVIGFKNTFNFYLGKPPSGTETGWVIREYKFNSAIIPRLFLPQDTKHKMETYVVCVVVKEIEDTESSYMDSDYVEEASDMDSGDELECDEDFALGNKDEM